MNIPTSCARSIILSDVYYLLLLYNQSMTRL